jgi:hypothetical protein
MIFENPFRYKLNYPNWSVCDFGATITIPVIVDPMGTINIFCDQIHNCPWKLIHVQVELSQLEGVWFWATITIPVIVGVISTINIFCDQIHNCPL